MIATRDLNGLMRLYADDCVLESSAVLVIEKKSSGVLDIEKRTHRLRSRLLGLACLPVSGSR
jgi:hypothetical protein